MIYRLEVLDRNPDGNDPSIYLMALVDDISKVDGVSDVSLSETIISFSSHLDISDIKNSFMPFFTRDYDFIQYVSIDRA